MPQRLGTVPHTEPINIKDISSKMPYQAAITQRRLTRNQNWGTACRVPSTCTAHVNLDAGVTGEFSTSACKWSSQHGCKHEFLTQPSFGSSWANCALHRATAQVAMASEIVWDQLKTVTVVPASRSCWSWSVASATRNVGLSPHSSKFWQKTAQGQGASRGPRGQRASGGRKTHKAHAGHGHPCT